MGYLCIFYTFNNNSLIINDNRYDDQQRLH
ncbi:MAG: hypothetical protein BWX49_00432 [Bacteroidetes bacterium ADurb.Bin008]|nr:MAG: hypothetical protein BWX49_00432 [Bacteroidetes bacterium ADurb.Bin008]